MAVYIFEQTQIDFLRSKKVTPFVKGRSSSGAVFDKPIVNGTSIKTGDTVYYIADSGFQFDLYSSDRASIGYGSPMGGSTWFKYDFENPSSAYQVMGDSYDKATIVILIPRNDDIEVKGVNDVFIIDDATMRGIINANFNFWNGQENKDYGQYILGLIDIPFTVDPELVAFENVPIKLAGYDTGFEGSLIKRDVLKIDLGFITTPKVKNNFLDFKNKTCVLHLPYSESIVLENQYVIGETITIEYQINLYDGVTVVNISSSKIEGVILTLNVDLNVSIPFGSVSSQPSKNDPRNVMLGGDNGVKNPYIEILSNDAILEDGFFTIPIVDEDLLSNQNGYVQIENVNLSSRATSSEKDMINNLLRGGVIIN